MASRMVSVVIPAYKNAEFLGETIRSVLDQTYSPVQIIVVDDGSPDNAAQVAGAFPGVIYVRQTNQGVCAARNTGLDRAAGEYIVFLDGDDRLLPQTIEIGVHELEAHPQCGFVYGFSRSIDEHGRPTEEPVPSGLVPESRRVANAGYAAMLAGSGLVPPGVACFRRSAAAAVGGFEVGRRLSDDYEFYLRVAREYPIHCHNHIVCEYRSHPRNTYRESPSANLLALIETLDRHRALVKGEPELERAVRAGKLHWAAIIGPSLAPEMVGCLLRGKFGRAWRAMLATIRYHPRGFLEYVVGRCRRGRG